MATAPTLDCYVKRCSLGSMLVREEPDGGSNDENDRQPSRLHHNRCTGTPSEPLDNSREVPTYPASGTLRCLGCSTSCLDDKNRTISITAPVDFISMGAGSCKWVPDGLAVEHVASHGLPKPRPHTCGHRRAPRRPFSQNHLGITPDSSAEPVASGPTAWQNAPLCISLHRDLHPPSLDVQPNSLDAHSTVLRKTLHTALRRYPRPRHARTAGHGRQGFVPKESPLWPGLVIDLSDPLDRRAEPRSRRSKGEQTTEGTTATQPTKKGRSHTKHLHIQRKPARVQTPRPASLFPHLYRSFALACS
jgi:hypothetical protein